MNEHNPIALAISLLQEKWNNSTKEESYQLVRWVIPQNNVEVFKGFLKLESTEHGNLQETFIVMFTPFESDFNFSNHLLKDWLEIFEKDVKKHNLPVWEEFLYFKYEFEELEEEDEKECNILLLKMLASFKKYEGKNSKLVVGILPNAVSDYKLFTKWLSKITKELPDDVALMVLDVAEKENFKDLFSEDSENMISILTGKLYDSGAIYEQLATQGNPDDPQVAFRKCMFEMGKEAKNGNKNGVYYWGDKALIVTQGSGDKLFWASSHIVFAGFLFGCNDTDKIEKLLKNGIQICESLLTDESKKPAASGLLGQFYGYKAAHLSIKKEYLKSIEQFQMQAEVLIENDQIILSLGAFQNALLVAAKHHKEKIEEIAVKGFNVGYPLEDELLRTSGFPVIAYYFLELNSISEEYKNEIEKRLSFLYSADWKKSAKNNLAIAPEEYQIK